MFKNTGVISHIVWAIDIEDETFHILKSGLSQRYTLLRRDSICDDCAEFDENGSFPSGTIIVDIDFYSQKQQILINKIMSNCVWSNAPVLFAIGTSSEMCQNIANRVRVFEYISKPVQKSVLMEHVKLSSQLLKQYISPGLLLESHTQTSFETKIQVLDMIADFIAFRDADTGEHCKRTTGYAELLVKKLQDEKHPRYKMDSYMARGTVLAAHLHDIGKIGISDAILLKPGKLNSDEFAIMKEHTTLGAQMLNKIAGGMSIEPMLLQVIHDVIQCHHERWDGSGYPNGYAGEQIPIAARIIAIADVYDALISRRSYGHEFSHSHAIDIIKKEAGTHFDPNLIHICRDVLDVFPNVLKETEKV